MMMKRIFTLAAALFAGSTLMAQDCADLFISEYVEGPGNNNAIEIYNPTTAPINLSGYSINRYSNGATANPDSWPLSGTIAAGEAIAIGNGQVDSVWVSTYWSLPVDTAFYNACAMHGSGVYPTPFYFNGDDAMTLEYNGNYVDIFGKMGEDPGGAWTDDASAGFTDANGGTWWTKRQTLIRKAAVKQGVTANPIAFNPSFEYDSLPDATYSNMGAHTCDCPTGGGGATVSEYSPSFALFPNPVVAGGTVSLSSTDKVVALELYNMQGKRLLVQESTQVSTENLAVGTYLLQLQFESGHQLQHQLIVQ